MSTPGSPAPLSLAERIRSYRVVALILVLGLVVGAVQVLGHGVTDLYHWTHQQLWPTSSLQSEYALVEQVQLNMDSDKATSILGEPVRTDGPLAQRTYFYSRPGYWMRVISADGHVNQVLITACRKDFNPRLFKNNYDVTLGVSTASDVRPNLAELDIGLNVAADSVSYTETSTAFFPFETLVTGWGWDSSCAIQDSAGPFFGQVGPGFECIDGRCNDYSTGTASPILESAVADFRKMTRLNTWEQCLNRCEALPGTSGTAGLALGR